MCLCANCSSFSSGQIMKSSLCRSRHKVRQGLVGRELPIFNLPNPRLVSPFSLLSPLQWPTLTGLNLGYNVCVCVYALTQASNLTYLQSWASYVLSFTYICFAKTTTINYYVTPMHMSDCHSCPLRASLPSVAVVNSE